MMRNLLLTGSVAILLIMLGALYYLSVAIAEEEENSVEVTYNSLRERSIPVNIYRALTKLREAIVSRDGTAASKQLEELRDITKRMDTLIATFVSGGEVLTAEGQKLRLRPIDTNQARDALRQQQGLWYPLKDRLTRLTTEGNKVDPALIAEALAYCDINGPQMEDLADTLVKEQDSYNDAVLYRLTLPRNSLVVMLAISTGLLVPAFVLLGRVRSSNDALAQTVGQLQKTTQDLEFSTAELNQSKQQSELILNTVLQGLILIDSHGVIGDKYSREAEEIFRMNNLAGMNLLNLLQRLLTEKTYNTTRDYFELLFNKALKERQVLKVNPLEELEVNFSKKEGGFITRYLGFTFRRIMRDGEVEQVLVTVNDVTRRVQLEQELRGSEQRKERQFELLLGILHVVPDRVEEFVVTTSQELEALNGVLKAEDFAQAAGSVKNDYLRKCLDTLFRHVHNIKGRASYLQLSYFERVVGQFEDKIHQLRNRPSLTGDDFLSLVICQADLRNDVAELKDISERLGSIRQITPDINSRARELALPEINRTASAGNKGGNDSLGIATVVAPSPVLSQQAEDITDGLARLAGAIAERQGNQVSLNTTEFDINAFRPEIHKMLRDVLIQLVRNAVTHGIETPEERQKQGKNPSGTITIALIHEGNNTVEGIYFHDDGRGLDYQKILKRAIDMELLAESESSSYGPEALAGLIFHPGFSTSEVVTVDAGRGVGMDFVYHAIVEKCGGEIAVCSEPKINCEYYLRLNANLLATT